MEVDFDKEIDTLLRKAHRDDPVLAGDFSSSRHLDADEISAFAENAMPENSRALYSAHLADCDRCRKILSNLLVMNAEAAPAAASPGVITIAERSVPWYSQLLLFPNLAYVMGGLVLIFAGFLGFTVIQRSGVGEDAMVSQSVESQSAQGGPNFQSEPNYSGDLETAANTTANTAANMTGSIPSAVMSNTNMSDSRSTLAKGPAGGDRAGENNFVLDGAAASSTDVTVTAVAPPAAAAQPAPPKDARERDDLAKVAKEEDKAVGMNIQEKAKNDAMLRQTSPGTAAQSGPMRNNESQYNRQLENLEARRAADKKSAKRLEESPSGRRTVGGKTFEGKEGVWYDTTYQGRPTINVRRGTDEFNRLDSGLRSIANSIGGTVVIVWGAKAYRIQ